MNATLPVEIVYDVVDRVVAGLKGVTKPLAISFFQPAGQLKREIQ